VPDMRKKSAITANNMLT